MSLQASPVMNARASNEMVIICAWSEMVCDIVYACMPFAAGAGVFFTPWPAAGPGVPAPLTAATISAMIQKAQVARPMVLDVFMCFIKVFSFLCKLIWNRDKEMPESVPDYTQILPKTGIFHGVTIFIFFFLSRLFLVNDDLKFHGCIGIRFLSFVGVTFHKSGTR